MRNHEQESSPIAHDSSFPDRHAPLGPLTEKLPPTQFIGARVAVTSNRENQGDSDLSLIELPTVGSRLLDFEIVAMIGQGAFATVYLARQLDLNNRHVVLKLSREPAGEPDVLAQLLHRNIVPIYSVHRWCGLTVTCMPFLGTTTLADIAQEIRESGLPTSGHYLIETLQEEKSTKRPSQTMRSPATETKLLAHCPTQLDDARSREIPVPLARTHALIEKLEAMSYAEAILWLGMELADGLAHAHERGILHRDIKPANVLLTHEGRPMLLDFNLSDDTKLTGSGQNGACGGTLAYMAPEQMEQFAKRKAIVDERSDIYALGVVLYELLAGRFPFRHYRGSPRKVLPLMYRDRMAGPPPFPKRVAGLTPAARAIIMKCLAPRPADRYQTALELHEDIRRHLDSKPLKYAKETSLLERFSKWRRRHPRLASLTSVTVVAVVLTSALAIGWHWSQEELRSHQARALMEQFEQRAFETALMFDDPAPDAKTLGRIEEQSKQTLSAYGLLKPPSEVRRLGHMQYLSAEHFRRVKSSGAQLLLLLARCKTLEAEMKSDPPTREYALRQALAYNRKAEALGAAEMFPRTLYGQRLMLASLLDDRQQKAEAERQLERIPAASDRDSLTLGRELFMQRNYRQSIVHLVRATERMPKDASAWYLRGRCHEQLRQYPQAIAAYTVCLALHPQQGRFFFRRGMAHLHAGEYTSAEADLNRAIALKTNLADAYANRALARRGLHRLKDSLADLETALKLGISNTRIHFVRSRVLEELGDVDRSKAERQLGLKRTPTDVQGWVARGMAKILSDPDGALADFRKALQLDPRSLPALVNIAHLLSQKPENRVEAVATLDRLLEYHPQYARGWVDRAILHARGGDRNAAIRDAEKALELSRSPELLFRAASVYALTSQTEPKDRTKALRLLTSALRQGFGWDRLIRNRDLLPLQGDPQFERVVNAASVLAAR